MSQTGNSSGVGTSLVIASLLLLATWQAFDPSNALAQADSSVTGTVVRVANTDGQALNLRAGPATDQPVLARLPSGESLTVTGSARTVGTTRWLPVRTAAGLTGWVAAEFVVVASTPTPIPTSVVEVFPSEMVGSSRGAAEPVNRAAAARPEQKGKPVEVEAKLKYPEVKGRDQEITVWVTREGAPVPGASVTLETSDGDEDERFRELDPTNEQGRTRRMFDVRHEKGTVELQVEAVAPDGGEGRTIVTYFRR